jgi:hypothetical protein
MTDVATAPALDLEGMTETDCADACTEECCVITGRRHVRFEDGTTGWMTHCGHPNKGGIQAAHKMMPQVKQNFSHAKRYLKRLEAEREKVEP